MGQKSDLQIVSRINERGRHVMQIHTQGSLPPSVLTHCPCTSTEETNLQESSFRKHCWKQAFNTFYFSCTEKQPLTQKEKAPQDSSKRKNICASCKLFVLSASELTERLTISKQWSSGVFFSVFRVSNIIQSEDLVLHLLSKKWPNNPEENSTLTIHKKFTFSQLIHCEDWTGE